MEEVPVEVAHGMPLVSQDEPAVRSEPADDRGLHVLAREQFDEPIRVLGRNGEEHPLLGLGDPDLRIRETFVLHRHLL